MIILCCVVYTLYVVIPVYITSVLGSPSADVMSTKQCNLWESYHVGPTRLFKEICLVYKMCTYFADNLRICVVFA